MLTIRPQNDDDHGAVQSVIAAAFATSDGAPPPVEVALNDELRLAECLAPGLTLVAELGGRIVGQVTSSFGTLTASDGSTRPVVGVGPVAVLPERQNEGIGSALMAGLVAAAAAAGEPALVLLGAPSFYSRFGFLPAAALGITSPDPTWGEDFQANGLGSPTGSLAGSFRYAAPFDRL
jgi:putative acetyltransferase